MPVNKPMQVDISPPSKIEVMREIDYFRRCEAAGTEGLSPPFFKVGANCYYRNQQISWDQSLKKKKVRRVYDNRRVLTNKKRSRSSCKKHREIILVSIIPKLLLGTIPLWLLSTGKKCMREDKAGFLCRLGLY